jgi:hypothetical protein
LSNLFGAGWSVRAHIAPASDKRVFINGRAGSHPARLFFPGCRNMICVSAEAAGWIAAVVLALVLVSAVIALGRRFSR